MAYIIILCYYFARGVVAKYCDEYVCVYVSVREDISGTTCVILSKFVMHVAYGHGSVLLWCRGAVAIRYVLLVLWMTSCFCSIMGRVAVQILL